MVRDRTDREAISMMFSARGFRIPFLYSLAAILSLYTLCAGCGGYSGGNGGGGTAPTAPTNLVATAANAQVNLTWNASSGATSYYVKRSTTSGTEAQIATVSTTSYSDNNVSNGTKYYYVVSAYNSYGQSANSAEVNATPAVPPPAAPSGLTPNLIDSPLPLT